MHLLPVFASLSLTAALSESNVTLDSTSSVRSLVREPSFTSDEEQPAGVGRDDLSLLLRRLAPAEKTLTAADLSPGLQNWPKKVWVPYWDVMLWNKPDLTAIYEQTGTKFYVTAFLVGSQSGCALTWGSSASLNAGPYSTFNDDINLLRSWGGDIVISFGGANGPELADTSGCQQGDAVANIKSLYEQVVDKYQLTHIDFDIEGNAVSASEHRQSSWKHRFEAVKQITAARPKLEVWWTLPILPTGLTADGVSFVNDLMDSGARFDRLNVMTMDYGVALNGRSMHDCEQEAMDNLSEQMFNTATQLGLASKYGWKSSADVWPVLGAIPMIGNNDVSGEVYTKADAQKSIAVWKKSKPIGLQSMWSISRDLPCAQAGASATCSGSNNQNQPYEYAAILGSLYGNRSDMKLKMISALAFLILTLTFS